MRIHHIRVMLFFLVVGWLVPQFVMAAPSVQSKQGKQKFTVVIDPGHGGKDPGAVGSLGVREKVVVLRIAKLLKSYIDREPGMRAVLTRHSDYYIGLRQRLRIARKHNADLFISIHADAYKNRYSQGASVFALSQRGATSEAARWLAEKENYSEIGGVMLGGLDDKSGIIRSVLIDLSQTATIGSSLQLGRAVLSNLNHVAGLHHSQVEQARFVVLKSPDIPSILVETGFISNPKEELKLQRDSYCKNLALAIFNGIRRHLVQNPALGAVLAKGGYIVHKVSRNESLKSIGQRYQIKPNVIKRYNNLQASSVYAGQILRIPKGQG